ncbi:MAG TPA: hypothetical protein VFK31_02775 [Rhodanobacteraceae bacterium]|nr:hypothetical protein [Rhodanobacteraceae bacterium]
MLIAGCAQNATTRPATSESSETSAPAVSQPSQTSAPEAEASSASVLPEKTGIPACDDYLASYKGCHRAAGIYAPDTIDDHYRTMRDTLLRESKDPTKRSVLEARCKSLAHMLKNALHGKSCEPAPSNDDQPRSTARFSQA